MRLLDHRRAALGPHAEVVLGGGEERRTHPHALCAERERRRDLTSAADAAGRQHRGVAPKSVNHFRHQHHRRDLAGVTTGLVTLRDDDVDAIVDMALRVLGATGQRRHRYPRGVHLVDDVLGR